MSGHVHDNKPIHDLDEADAPKRAGLAAILAFSGFIVGIIVMIVLLIVFSHNDPVATNGSSDGVSADSAEVSD